MGNRPLAPRSTVDAPAVVELPAPSSPPLWAHRVGEAPHRALPVELGTVWGLERGAFVGLLADAGGHDVVACLQSSEAALGRVRARSALSLPSRSWIGIEVTPSSPLLPRAGDPAPAVVLTARVHTTGSAHALERACATLLSAHRGRALALVVHVIGPTTTAETLVRRLHGLYAAKVKLVDALVIAGTTAPRPTPSAPAAGEPSADPDENLHRLLQRLFERVTPDEERGERVLERFPALRSARDHLGPRFPGPPRDTVLLSRVVATLDARAGWTSAGIDPGQLGSELLRLTAAYDPASLSSLVGCCASSTSPALHRAALVAAVAADHLMDAWVDGAVHRLGQAPGSPGRAGTMSRLLASDPIAGPVAGDLILALLRRARRGDPDARPIVEWLLPGQLQHYAAIAQLCLAGGNAGPIDPRRAADAGRALLDEHGPLALWLACRGGWEPPHDGAWLVNAPIEHAGWRFLSTMAPREGWIAALLGAPPSCRAVLGLCTQDERRALAADASLEELVVAARGRRPVADPTIPLATPPIPGGD
jgi:hypothetical protein